MNKFFLIVSLKFIVLILIGLLAEAYLHYLGNFPFRSDFQYYHLPNIIQSLANFDGLHYLKISRIGYYQFSQAFFPLYPLLIHVLSPLFGSNGLLAGLLISNISFIIGLYYLYELAKSFLKKNELMWFVLFILLFPTAFFFQTVYTEGLFFMLTVLTFYFCKKNYIAAAAATAFLAALTRIPGIFLFLPFLALYLKDKHKHTSALLYSIAPCLGLLTYMIYLWNTVGDPLAFFHSQSAFGAGRSTHLITTFQTYYRYFKIFFTSAFNFGYFIAVIEFLATTFVIITSALELYKRYQKKDYLLISLALFSLINILIPTLTGTFLSEPRFALLSLSSFIYLGAWKNVPGKIITLMIFVLLQIVLFASFIQGYFVS